MIKKLVQELRRRSRQLKLEQLKTELNPQPCDTFLDVGVADLEYDELENYIIKKYPYPEKITALGLGELSNFKKRYPYVKTVSYPGGRFPFSNDAFDIAHANAVIEHVGDFQKQLFFLQEMFRVSKKGMLTTPNKWFLLETHTKVPFLHWLPKAWFDRFLVFIGKPWATGDHLHLLSYRALKRLARFAGIKNYKLYKNRFFIFTTTFSLFFEKKANH